MIASVLWRKMKNRREEKDLREATLFATNLLPEFRLDETRIVFIAMRKLSPRSFKKNNAACKVSLLEFNKVRARAVSFNYSRIARESTKYI